jgi:diadenosine tetraphosphate (Ap4A) HIT family hydrolase
MTDTEICPFCQIADGSRGADAGIVFQDEHWLVRTISPTPAVAGWLLLQARRHIADSAELDAAEAASFGPLLQRASRAVREVTGALRIYLGSLNEGTPHFHTHILPRLPEMPNGAIGFDAFGLSALARRGEVRADPEAVQRIVAQIRDRLQVRTG